MPRQSGSSDDPSDEEGVDTVLEACSISADGPKSRPAVLKKDKQSDEPLDPESDRKRRASKSARSKEKERTLSSKVQGGHDDEEVERGRRRNDKNKNDEAETKQASSTESDEPASAAGSKKVSAADPDIP